MTLYKVLKYVAFALGGLGLILFFWLISKGDDAVVSSPELQDSIMNPFLILTYVTIAIAVVSVLVFVLAGLMGGNIKKTVISLGAFLLVFLIAYFMADSEDYVLPNGTPVSGSVSKWVDTGLVMFYILGVAAVLVLIGSSLKKLTFRN